MRLVVILTLALGVCGPTLADTEKVVFVVPRYIRRSFSNNAAPFYKIRIPKRPFFVGHHAGSPGNSDHPFFPGGKQAVGQNSFHGVPHGGGNFGKNFAAPQQQQYHREVQNQVIIPHGKGISHGVSFGKGYIPQEELKRAVENYAGFPGGNDNQLQDSPGQSFNFEDEGFQRFEGREENFAPQEPRWIFPPSNEGEQNQEPRVEHEGYKMFEEQGSLSPPNEQLFYPKFSEQPRPISDGVHPSARMTERKLTPIVLQDTIDMKEYIAKVEAFTRSWPLQGLAWNNQQSHFPGANSFPHIQGANPWTASFPSNPSGGYEVQEESVEEPMKRSFTVTMM